MTEISLIRSSLFATLLAVALLCPNIGHAATRNVEGIAAIVNDQVISLYDVDQRVDLFLATSGIARTPETVDRLRGQVLRSLVDEKLQLQEAKDVEIDISKSEVDDDMKRMAQQTGRTVEQVLAFLAENNIDENTLRQQILAELAWDQFVRRRYGGRITISKTDIDEQYRRAVDAIDQPSYLISEILIASDGAVDDAQVRGVTEEIIRQLQAGVEFPAIARQLSSSASAARGGDVGWVDETQLDPRIQAALREMQPGQISSPIPTPAGIYIIGLRDKRAGGGKSPLRNQFDLLNIAFAKGETTAIQALHDNFRTCTATQSDAKEKGASVSERTGLQPLGAFDPSLRGLVAPLEAGQLTPVMEAADSMVFIVVCDRKDDIGVQVSRDAIENNLYSQRIAMMARRHLRDLRRDSIVEYR